MSSFLVPQSLLPWLYSSCKLQKRSNLIQDLGLREEGSNLFSQHEIFQDAVICSILEKQLQYVICLVPPHLGSSSETAQLGEIPLGRKATQRYKEGLPILSVLKFGPHLLLDIGLSHPEF